MPTSMSRMYRQKGSETSWVSSGFNNMGLEQVVKKHTVPSYGLMCMYMCIYIYIHMDTYIYVYIHIYIYT